MPVKMVINLFQDLRYGIRRLRKSPGFTAITALTLALGIGANTAIFSVVDSVLLRSLPYKDPDRLVAVWDKGPNGGRNGYSAASLLDRRDENRVFERLAGWAQQGFNLSGQDLPERVEGMLVSWDFFKTLGVMPALGRSFDAEEDRPGASHVAVLSHGLWQRKFGGDPTVVGRSATVDGQMCTVIGIMPPRFRFFYGPEMWMPLALNRASASRDVSYLSVVGRLKPGVSLSEAGTQWGGLVEPLRAETRQGQPKGLLVLFGAVGFLLLIACVNVANLLLARAAERRHELAVRASLGAGRTRLLRQLLTESVLLALTGGLFGSVLAFRVVEYLPALVSPVLLSGCPEIAVDWRVLAFTLALSIFTGLFFGVLPAWRASRLDLHDVLKEGGRSLGAASSQARLRGVLVVAQIALSLLLLVSAGLMIRSLLEMQKVDLGFRADHVVTMRLSIAEGLYPGAVPVRALYRRVLETVSSIPGVRSAGLSMGQAPWDSPIATEFDILGHPRVSVSEVRGAVLETVSPDYFRTLGIGLRKGRSFTERDNETTLPVVIVNQTFVKLYLPNVETLGQRLLVHELAGQRQIGREIAWEIVGVVEDVKFGGPTANSVQMIYAPIMQNPSHEGALALRTSTEPTSVAQTVRAALAQIDRNTPVTQVKTMDRIVVESMSQPRLQTWILGLFAAIALTLAALGNYGVMSHFVAQHTHDIGIRMALGASGRDVLKLVLRKGILLTGAGLLVGLAGALALTRFLSSLLFNVKATDPWTFAVVSLLLAFVALLAAFIPARRATRVDPIVALRCE